MIPQERATKRHERILDAALRVFARKGYRDAAVDDIATESRTSKGGVYFHFPGKQAIFLELLDRTAARLRRKIQETIEVEPDPMKRADAALVVVLRTFASHRALARLFMIEALGAGKEFHQRLSEIHDEFATIIKEQLDEAVRLGVVPPLDTQVAATAWFGALNEVVMRWLLSGKPARLHDAYDALRPLLIRSVGAKEKEAEEAFGDQLRTRLGAAIERARDASRAARAPVLASVTLRSEPFDPVAVFERASRGPASYWQQPSEGIAMVGAGEAWRVTSSGDGRFGEARAEWRRLTAMAVVDAGTAPFEAPIAITVFAFGPATSRRGPQLLPDAAVVVPRLLFTTHRNESWLTVSIEVTSRTEPTREVAAVERDLAGLLGPAQRTTEPAGVPRAVDDDDRPAWEAAVTALLSDIEAGRAQKVVLARAVVLEARLDVDVADGLRRLGARYGGCTLFAFARDGRCFFGATPERLLRIQDGVVSVDALAGSISRGRDDSEDRALASKLLHDPKELHEHAVVAAAIEEALAPLCATLELAPAPRIVSFANVHHLYTPVSAMALPGHDVFELVESLHPTPATGGYPREAALALIPKYESFDRGWYAGPCGWVDAGGNGEFVVAIRSALVEGRRATLYAGCGIVAGSDPEREYDESTVKLQAMLWALGAE